MKIDLNAIEFEQDALLFHHIKALLVLTEERFKFDSSAQAGEPIGLLLDNEHLTIVVPVYCCRAHKEVDEEPIAFIIIDKIKTPGWRFDQRVTAQA